MIAQEQQCYKVILDCEPEKLDFYQKCHLEKKGFQMAKYFV